MKTVLEYVWLDANEKLRSKVKVAEGNISSLEKVPVWSYDGSSTDQAPGDHSDVTLTPVKLYPNPFLAGAFLVMCSTEKREAITFEDSDGYWFGFEQEYFITNGTGKPLGWENGEPGPQGPYYCGIGASKVAGRDVVSDHMTKCIEANIDITGTNAEVALGQWE